MKFRITILIMAGIALASLSSCEIFVRGQGHGHGHGHGQGDRDQVQPRDTGLQNSFVAPSILQPSAQLPPKTIAVFNFE